MAKLSLILGIRPDVIRASLMIKTLKERLGGNFEFVWSGQHYSDNMKDVFFRELDVPQPDRTLQVNTDSDTSLIGTLISEMGLYLEEARPDAVVFLGDTNTVLGSLAAASAGIPIAHIEGCMRSYDWRMPEEKYRSTVDHLSDVIYAYLPEYKSQGVLEGIREESIVLTGNPIVDVLEHYFLSGRIRMTRSGLADLLETFQVQQGKFWTMTCHRRENVENEGSLRKIIRLAESVESPVVFAAGYRTQRQIRSFGIRIPANVRMIDPIGYVELLELISSSQGVLSDSGTVVEETAVLGTPTIQMRTSTERPQVYDTGLCMKFDPLLGWDDESMKGLISTTGALSSNAPHGLGDGQASARITDDLIKRLTVGNWPGHSFNIDERPLTRNFGTGLKSQGQFSGSPQA